ncbi:MAG TPA: hypothetical protein VI790_06495 [Candidatus Nanoarchaeia archaeon]|nr:hypothetical protein [Candidatus Nanoarchaeia archaeon]
MSPIELSVVIISSVLVTLLLLSFLNDLMLVKKSANDERDLVNVLLIYSNGVSNGVNFSVNYKPLRDGFLEVTASEVFLNNKSRSNPGISLVNCSYDVMLINGSGVFCLKN